MATIVCVHGIAQQNKGEETLQHQWSAPLRDGLRRVGPAGHDAADRLTETHLRYVFYGDVFRPPGRTLGPGEPNLTVDDLTEYEHELALAWWTAAAATDPAVIAPDARTLARTPTTIQAALRALSCSTFLIGLTERALVGNLVQVRRYFTEPAVRDAARQQLTDAIDDDTRVIVAHSLGSVVAYEALAAHPDWPVHTLITLGSPLGIRNLIFDRLQPEPLRPLDGTNPVAAWPGSIKSWTNIADEGDIVALVKDLRPQFGTAITCHTVHNGAQAHSIEPYLTAPETGTAILAGL